MAATVVQHGDLAILAPHDDERAPRDRGADEAAGPRNLALMPDIAPGAREDALELELEDRRIAIDAPVHPPRLHQRGDGVGAHLS